MLIELSVKYVLREPLESRYFMILRAPNDEQGRYIRICVGQSEGEAVKGWLNSVVPPRPMTYDLICSLFDVFDNTHITKIIIDGCEKDVFYAKMVVSVNGEEKIIDCRPSDAVAIAVRMKIPIFAECCVMDKHGICCDSCS